MQDLYRNKSVTVIGGGLAGLSSAVFLAEKGFNVSIYEAAPKFGGRVYSFFDKINGLKIDNGQHILASWYLNTFDYLKIIGSSKLIFQEQLEVNFADKCGSKFTLKAVNLPPPLHLAGGIMGFKALGLNDKLAIIKLINSIKKGKFTISELSKYNTDKLFKISKQTDRSIEYFWKPFIIAVFNAVPGSTSAMMFTDMIKSGFIKKGNSNLVLPDGYLSDIFIDPAISFLQSKNASIKSNCGIEKLNIKNNTVTSIILENKTEIKSDFYVCAVPFYSLKNMFNEQILNEHINLVFGLKPSPIVNIHLKFNEKIEKIFTNGFFGLLGTVSQWAFKVKDDQICIVVSAADKVAEMDKHEIIKIAVNDLNNCLPEMKKYNVIYSKVIKEMRATFVPDTDSLQNRPDTKTKINNLLLAGDWTNTGLPATIEGAVKSGKSSANAIMELIQ